MRRSLASLSAVILIAGSLTAPAGARSVVDGAPESSVTVVKGDQIACRGCGCRGGAGYRLPNGKCAGRRG